MMKRIPCRVVKSVPLGNSRGVSRRTSRSNNKHCKIGDVVAEDVQVRGAGSSVTYTGWLGVAKVPVDGAPAGQILDCYA